VQLDIRFAKQADYNSCSNFDQFNIRATLEEKIRKELALLAFSDQECVGYLSWDWFWGKTPYLCLIKVREDARSQGVGSALLAFWIEHLKGKGVDYCLSSSQENEPSAVEWHLKKGFTEIGRLATLNEDGSNEIFMRKELSRGDRK
jgi:ribosomal protein S18 acetylase RimI-like enzyme